MKADAQRIAIATACGWDRLCTHEVNGVVVQYGHPPQSHLRYETPIPDYLADLNACAEMEKVLNFEQTWEYRALLQTAVLSVQEDGRATKSIHFLYGATAAQRCEAFLRALNLWEEDDV